MSNARLEQAFNDIAEVLRLDEGWNAAYCQHDRSPLAAILAEDFAGLSPSGEPVTKASLMLDPPGRARSVVFSDQEAWIYGDAAVSRGRLRLELEDRSLDQWFLRVFAKRNGRWQAVSVAVTAYAGPSQ